MTFSIADLAAQLSIEGPDYWYEASTGTLCVRRPLGVVRVDHNALWRVMSGRLTAVDAMRQAEAEQFPSPVSPFIAAINHYVGTDA